MTSSRLGICLLLLASLAVSAAWGLAGDDDDPTDDRRAVRIDRDDDRDDDRSREERRLERGRRQDSDRDRPRDDEKPANDDSPSDGDHAGHHVARTVKLEFTLVGEEEPSFIVLCAANDYLLSHDVSEPNFEHALEIGGVVEPTDDPDRIFMTFQAMTHHADFNEGIDATFKATGSASLKIGVKTTLATLGDEPLTVTATTED